MYWIKYILVVSMLASILGFSSLSAQYQFQGDTKQKIISLHAHAKHYYAGNTYLNIDKVVRFCNPYLRVKVRVENSEQQSLKYYSTIRHQLIQIIHTKN